MCVHACVCLHGWDLTFCCLFLRRHHRADSESMCVAGSRVLWENLLLIKSSLVTPALLPISSLSCSPVCFDATKHSVLFLSFILSSFLGLIFSSYSLWWLEHINKRLLRFSLPFRSIYFCFGKRKSSGSHMMFVCGCYLLRVIKLLSWSFIHLINNSALGVEHRNPAFIGTHSWAKKKKKKTQVRTYTQLTTQEQLLWSQHPFHPPASEHICMQERIMAKRTDGGARQQLLHPLILTLSTRNKSCPI